MSQGTTVTMFSDANATRANNISSKEVWGAKRRENVFINSVNSHSGGNSSYVTGKTRATNDIQGKIVDTGVVSDIAIDGAGYLVVSDSVSGASKFTRRGDFRQDELGYWKNGADQILKAWKLQANGDMPQNSSTIASLEAVNFSNVKGTPLATSVVSIAMNLNASQDALRGETVTTSLRGENLGKDINKIIIPGSDGTAKLTIGDTFVFKSSTTNEDRPVQFGGLVAGNQAGPGDMQIFGAAGARARFNIVNAPGVQGDLVAGHQIKITVSGGESVVFTAVRGNPSATNGTFNSIQSLADAINRVRGLTAEVDRQVRLYIAPEDADNGLTFEDIGVNCCISEKLGLYNLAARQGNEDTRFNSLKSLQKAINYDPNLYSLKATIEGKKLDISSLLATADFSITANSFGRTTINSAVRNPLNNETERATVFISAPSHGLVSGDLVKITGVNQLTNGLYVVGDFNSNGFEVYQKLNNAQFPAAARTPLGLAAGASWTKAPGRQEAADVTEGTITTSGNAGAGGAIRITSNNHGLVNNDAIYVSGGTFLHNAHDITLPRGYYNVTRIDANVFEITSTTSAGAGGNPMFQGVTFDFRKIGVTGGNVANLETRVFDTQHGAGLNSSVRMYMPHHSYAVNDNISFTDLAANGLDVDGITVRNNIRYKITAIGNDYIEFQVFDQNGAVVPATTGDGNTGAVASSDLLLANLEINQGAKLMNFFNFGRHSEGHNHTDDLSYTPSYDANDANKNLSGANFSSSLVYPTSITVYDSLGASHNLSLNFAKLNDNEWAVELSTPKDANGIYSVIDADQRDGLIQAGIIRFDESGALQGVPEGFEDEISVQYNNGSEPVRFTIDWANELSQLKSGTVTQFNQDNDVQLIQNDGHNGGSLEKVEVGPDGYIMGTFSNGETLNLYKVPLAMFANVNGLVAGANDTFEMSKDSGSFLLKAAGAGGAGKTLGGTLESSNVDTTEELLGVQNLSNDIRANARVVAVDNENFKNVLAELNR